MAYTPDVDLITEADVQAAGFAPAKTAASILSLKATTLVTALVECKEGRVRPVKIRRRPDGKLYVIGQRYQ